MITLNEGAKNIGLPQSEYDPFAELHTTPLLNVHSTNIESSWTDEVSSE